MTHRRLAMPTLGFSLALACAAAPASGAPPWAGFAGNAQHTARAAPTQELGRPAGAVYEWCLNSAAIDLVNGLVFANSEDGHVYRWNLATNRITAVMTLNPPVPEAYTMTVIGPDGTIYVINNSTLHAIGD